jgi:hypothetical protein
MAFRAEIKYISEGQKNPIPVHEMSKRFFLLNITVYSSHEIKGMALR